MFSLSLGASIAAARVVSAIAALRLANSDAAMELARFGILEGWGTMRSVLLFEVGPRDLRPVRLANEEDMAAVGSLPVWMVLGRQRNQRCGDGEDGEDPSWLGVIWEEV